MVSLFHHAPHFPFPTPPSPPRTRSRLRTSISCSMTSSSNPLKWRSKLLEFPHLSTSHRNLMLDLFSSIDTHLGSQLLPSSIAPNVASFENETRTSQGSLDIRLGQDESTIDFMVGCWLHCQLPSGSSLDITTLFAFLKSTTDAPHLLLEFIQSSPNSLILYMDLLPRKDLVLHPDYLQTFYQNTLIENQRQKLDKLPETQPYLSSNLYLRGILSPTSISVSINCENMEEMVRDHVGDVVKEMLRIWLESCGGKREIGEMEREILVRRDDLLKRNAVEMDISANLPRLFSPEVAERVKDAIQKVFRIESK
ncbi:red chlorophyll catabolite reductase-like [Tasmannia lanceolata]|uniref:red chlorophyll catabolite reductase-like n=1 Tax=Tasmannia lanceolata TaxID=3420 RepID=UPI004063146F